MFHFGVSIAPPDQCHFTSPGDRRGLRLSNSVRFIHYASCLGTCCFKFRIANLTYQGSWQNMRITRVPWEISPGCAYHRHSVTPNEHNLSPIPFLHSEGKAQWVPPLRRRSHPTTHLQLSSIPGTLAEPIETKS